MPVRTVRPTQVLLVEDNEDHALLITRALNIHSVSAMLTHMPDGEEAMAFLRRQGRHQTAPRPDVTLLDLNLPRKSGYEVLDEVKRDPALCTIPVVILTTSRADLDRERSYRASANSYLVKPVEFGRFDEMIRCMMSYWTIWNEPPDELLADAASIRVAHAAR